MKVKITRLAFFVLISGIFLYSGISQKRDTKESQEIQEAGSLIKKDLLNLLNKRFLSPQRNIFMRQRVNQQNEISPSTPGNFQTPGAEDSSPREEIKPKDIGFNMNYIGYVQSGDRVVALVLLEGRALTVESGDVLEAGVTIGEISPIEIEVIGSDSVLRRIKLEGEWP